MGASPLSQPKVLDPPHVPLGDALGVSNDQNANSLPNGKGDDLAGSLVLGLVDTATMTGLGLPLPGSVAAPSARAPLPRLGIAARRPALTGLLIAEVQIVLSTNRAARDQQPRLLADNRIWMDNAEVHSRNSIGVQIMLLDRNGGGDSQP
jgi:hypothetical protein